MSSLPSEQHMDNNTFLELRMSVDWASRHFNERTEWALDKLILHG